MMKTLSNRALLMIIDLQKAIDHPDWGERNNPDAEERIAELLEVWRRLKMPLLHVKHMSKEPNSNYRPGQEGNDFKEVAQPRAEEEVLEKGTNSAFIGTGLERTLNQRGITEIVVAGVITNNSVEATARMSGNLGFRTLVVSDATFTFEKHDYAGQLRTAQEVHHISLANLSGEYAEVACTSEVLTLLADTT